MISYTYKSGRPKVFCKKVVLRNFAKFTGKHLCQSLFLNKVAGLRPEISKKTFFYRTPLVAASVPIILECFSGIGQCIIARIQGRILNPVKRLRWIFSRNTIFSRYLLLRKASFKMFDIVLNVPEEYVHFIYIL